MRRAGGRVAAALACAALAIAGCGRPAHRATRPPLDLALAPGPCLIVTAPHAKDAFTANPGAQVEAPRCEVHVDSDDMFYAAQLNAGSRLDTSLLCVAGDIDRHGGLVSEPRRVCSANLDHFDRPPPPEAAAPCGPSRAPVNGGEATLSPGVYCGGLAFGGGARVTFAPGTYVVRGGDWTFGPGTYVGRGVSLYFADGSRPAFGRSAAVDLAAPTTGARSGVLMDEARGLPPSELAVGAASLRLEGLVHLPSRRATFDNGSRLASPHLLLVLHTVVLDATQWTIAGPWRP